MFIGLPPDGGWGLDGHKFTTSNKTTINTYLETDVADAVVAVAFLQQIDLNLQPSALASDVVVIAVVAHKNGCINKFK